MIEFVDEARTATGYSTKSFTQTGVDLLVGLFRSWFKSDYPVTRNVKPKIGLKHRNKVDIKLRLLKDNVASSHIISFSFFLFFWLDFQFVGISKARRSPSGLRCWQ